MAQRKFCQNCNPKNNCQEVSHKLGNAQGQSVVFGVIMAFLLPLVVFIVSLAAFDRILAKTIDAKQLQTALSFLMALLTTFACILITRVINRQLSKNK